MVPNTVNHSPIRQSLSPALIVCFDMEVSFSAFNPFNRARQVTIQLDRARVLDRGRAQGPQTASRMV